MKGKVFRVPEKDEWKTMPKDRKGQRVQALKALSSRLGESESLYNVGIITDFILEEQYDRTCTLE